MKSHALRRNLSLFLAVAAMIASACELCFPWDHTPACEAPRTPTATPKPPTPTVAAAAACTVDWISPAHGATLPNFGAFMLQWNTVPGAAAYKVRFYPDGSTPDPSQEKQTTDTSLRIYMESHPEGGNWNFEVDALDAAGQPLCTGMVTAQKDAYTEPAANSGGNGQGGDAGGGTGSGCSPSDPLCSPSP